ncbi:uncharacterized protein V6R79_016398 [Siganus canaliculatus]
MFWPDAESELYVDRDLKTENLRLVSLQSFSSLCCDAGRCFLQMLGSFMSLSVVFVLTATESENLKLLNLHSGSVRRRCGEKVASVCDEKPAASAAFLNVFLIGTNKSHLSVCHNVQEEKVIVNVPRELRLSHSRTPFFSPCERRGLDNKSSLSSKYFWFTVRTGTEPELGPCGAPVAAHYRPRDGLP